VIYLHCGWPKTGTTTLQAALVKHEDRLATAGVVYPERWRSKGDFAHHGLSSALGASVTSPGAAVGLAEMLTSEAEADLLISCESITVRLMSDEGAAALRRFLRAAQGREPVTCLWALRRFDEMAHSGCIHGAIVGEFTGSPRQVAKGLHLERILPHMRQVHDVVEGRVIYAKYSSTGAHNLELIRALGLPDDVASLIGDELATSARLNAGVTHKQFVAIVNAEELSARAGIRIDKRSLLDLFRSGKFRFKHDRPCELLGREVRDEVHRQALQVARDCGFAPYIHFFADDGLDEIPAPANLDQEVIGNEDLTRLVAHLDASASCSTSPGVAA
jgi:hypothetical protein